MAKRFSTLAAVAPVPGRPLPHIVLFQHNNYNREDGNHDGWVVDIYDAVNLEEGLNDNASSAMVVSGTWRLWRNHNNRPDGDEGYLELPVGYYPSLEEAGLAHAVPPRAGWNDTISSLAPNP